MRALRSSAPTVATAGPGHSTLDGGPTRTGSAPEQMHVGAESTRHPVNDAESPRGHVIGAGCLRGHVNATGARYCQVCGLAVQRGATTVGRRPVVGALVRADGIRVLLLDEVALSACPPPAMPTVAAPTVVTARIVFLDWDPFALAETAGVRWAEAGGTLLTLEPGEAAPLRAGAQLVIGLDAYTYEPLAAAIEHDRPRTRRRGRGHRRRRGRLPDRSLFRPAD